MLLENNVTYILLNVVFNINLISTLSLRNFSLENF